MKGKGSFVSPLAIGDKLMFQETEHFWLLLKSIERVGIELNSMEFKILSILRHHTHNGKLVIITLKRLPLLNNTIQQFLSSIPSQGIGGGAELFCFFSPSTILHGGNLKTT